MLQILDKSTKALLELADHIELLSPSDFDMGCWCRCVAGYAVSMRGYTLWDWHLIEERARRELGISSEIAEQLFNPPDPNDPTYVATKTPHEAARTLRHLAVTGEVVW